MEVINDQGIDDGIALAVSLQDKEWYSGWGEDRYASCTELLKPPGMVALERAHADEIEEEI